MESLFSVIRVLCTRKIWNISGKIIKIEGNLISTYELVIIKETANNIKKWIIEWIEEYKDI